MTTPKDVLIAGERHLIILGQMGNMHAGLLRLVGAMEDGDDILAMELIGVLNDELTYLQKVYPQMDGGLDLVAVSPVSPPPVPPPIKGSVFDEKIKVAYALKDMRILMDAASATYIHEGTIDCHLKTMLDAAWHKAANAAGISDLDDAPF